MPTPAEVFGKGLTQPTPDGKIIVFTIWGTTHEYSYRDMMPYNNGWRPTSRYLSIATVYGRVNWPWASVAHFETHHNSDGYVAAHRVWKAKMDAIEAAHAKNATEDEVAFDE